MLKIHNYDTLTNLLLYIFAVALYTSAWIEITFIIESGADKPPVALYTRCDVYTLVNLCIVVLCEFVD